MVYETNTVSLFYTMAGLVNLCFLVLVEDAGLYQNNGENVSAINLSAYAVGLQRMKYNGTKRLPPPAGRGGRWC